MVLQNLLLLIVFLNLSVISSNNDKVDCTGYSTESKKIEVIKFDPEHSTSYPFDSLFKSIKLLKVEEPYVSKIKGIVKVVGTDSFIVVARTDNYLVYDMKGNFKNRVGTYGEGPNSLSMLTWFYADNDYILAMDRRIWKKYSIAGSVLSEGSLPYGLNSGSFISLGEKGWLFYNMFMGDTLRLWTTDQKFKIKKEYLFFVPTFKRGQSNMLGFIYPTNNGIYITDQCVDTIYKFNEKSADPVYVFNFGNYKCYRGGEMRELARNEIARLFTIVSANYVICQIVLNKQYYFVIHNRINNTTRTINKLVNGPDLVNSWTLKGTDKNDRLYWQPGFRFVNFPQVEKYAIKLRYADLLKQKGNENVESKTFLIITTTR